MSAELRMLSWLVKRDQLGCAYTEHPNRCIVNGVTGLAYLCS